MTTFIFLWPSANFTLVSAPIEPCSMLNSHKLSFIICNNWLERNTHNRYSKITWFYFLIKYYSNKPPLSSLPTKFTPKYDGKSCETCCPKDSYSYFE